MHNMQSDICKLDFSACGTLASQLADNISRAIACGDLKPGDTFSSFALDGLWVTTRTAPRRFSPPTGVPTRLDLSWDPS